MLTIGLNRIPPQPGSSLPPPSHPVKFQLVFPSVPSRTIAASNALSRPVLSPSRPELQGSTTTEAKRTSLLGPLLTQDVQNKEPDKQKTTIAKTKEEIDKVQTIMA